MIFIQLSSAAAKRDYESSRNRFIHSTSTYPSFMKTHITCIGIEVADMCCTYLQCVMVLLQFKKIKTEIHYILFGRFSVSDPCP
uniref:Uncharacterized protein n=1 Tax=Trichogramma kaykai TaxID=54128 RepID=A0ABD2WVW1_9HYME